VIFVLNQVNDVTNVVVVLDNNRSCYQCPLLICAVVYQGTYDVIYFCA